VNIWQTLGEEKRLANWIGRAEARFRESLECFKICAAYYYRKNDRKRLGEIIKEIKNYSLPLDIEAIEWIRFFDIN